MMLFNPYPEIWVPLGFFVLVGFIVYLIFKNKERKAGSANGLSHSPHGEYPDHFEKIYRNIRQGLMLIGIGLGFLTAKILIYQGIFDDSFTSYFSLIAIFSGTGMIMSYFIAIRLAGKPGDREQRDTGNNHSGQHKNDKSNK